MPAIIDHDARRQMLAALAAELIARDGLAAATVRGVAEEAGFSTKVVSHYFVDKRHLLLEAYRFAASDSAERARAAQGQGEVDAAAFAASLCPTSPAMIRNWKVWFAFWGFAISDGSFATVQAQQIAAAERRLADLLSADRKYAPLDAVARDRLASEVMVSLLGVALRAVFDLARWPAERQRAVILDRFRLALAAAGAPAADRASLANPAGARN